MTWYGMNFHMKLLKDSVVRLNYKYVARLCKKLSWTIELQEAPAQSIFCTQTSNRFLSKHLK